MVEKGMNPAALKKINRDKVYKYIYQQKEVSKQQIVQDLHLGLSTVSQNLNELEQEGRIRRDRIFNQQVEEKHKSSRLLKMIVLVLDLVY